MSIMDDVFDLRDHLKDDPNMAAAFDRVENRLWEYERVNDIAAKLYNRQDDAIRAFNELVEIMSEGKKR